MRAVSSMAWQDMLSSLSRVMLIFSKKKKKIKVYYTLYVVPYLLYTMYNLTNFYIISGKL
jgi:hypothetical protein